MHAIVCRLSAMSAPQSLCGFQAVDWSGPVVGNEAGFKQTMRLVRIPGGAMLRVRIVLNHQTCYRNLPTRGLIRHIPVR